MQIKINRKLAKAVSTYCLFFATSSFAQSTPLQFDVIPIGVRDVCNQNGCTSGMYSLDTVGNEVVGMNIAQTAFFKWSPTAPVRWIQKPPNINYLSNDSIKTNASGSIVFDGVLDSGQRRQYLYQESASAPQFQDLTELFGINRTITGFNNQHWGVSQSTNRRLFNLQTRENLNEALPDLLLLGLNSAMDIPALRTTMNGGSKVAGVLVKDSESSSFRLQSIESRLPSQTMLDCHFQQLTEERQALVLCDSYVWQRAFRYHIDSDSLEELPDSNPFITLILGPGKTRVVQEFADIERFYLTTRSQPLQSEAFAASGLLPSGNYWKVTYINQVTESLMVVADAIDPSGRRMLIAMLPRRLDGDLDFNGTVNTSDLIRFIAKFGTSIIPGDPADINRDGVVNSLDLMRFLAMFGKVA